MTMTPYQFACQRIEALNPSIPFKTGYTLSVTDPRAVDARGHVHVEMATFDGASGGVQLRSVGLFVGAIKAPDDSTLMEYTVRDALETAQRACVEFMEAEFAERTTPPSHYPDAWGVLKATPTSLTELAGLVMLDRWDAQIQSILLRAKTRCMAEILRTLISVPKALAPNELMLRPTTPGR
jgi:hypothetical protein